MSTGFGYGLAFMTGITGAFHCLGMCGSFAGGYFVVHGWRNKLIPHIAYHGMRLFSYVLLGMGGALAGRVLAQSGLLGKGQGILMIIAGLLIIGSGLWVGNFLPWRRNRHCGKTCNMPQLQDLGKGRYLPLLAGLMNGLVPCSLVFSVAIKALTSNTLAEAGLFMLVFGIGTLPVMLLVTLTGASLGSRVRGVFIPAAGLLVMLMGSWTLYEGIVFYDIMRGLAN